MTYQTSNRDERKDKVSYQIYFDKTGTNTIVF